MDIQLEPSVQRKGLGRHLMRTVEMIARKQVAINYLQSTILVQCLHVTSRRNKRLMSFGTEQEMSYVMMPVVVKNEGAKDFVLHGLNGWTMDDFSAVVRRAIMSPSSCARRGLL